MRPLNFAVLKYFTEVESASYVEVMEALKAEYGNFKQFTIPAISEALMTAEQNYILEEVDFQLNEDGTGRFYYTAPEEGKQTINTYIK